jgi:hypothetical protein
MSSTKKEFINPVRVFFAIIIVVLIWFTPIAKTPKQAAIKEKPTLLEYAASPRLILAVPEVNAGCPNQCQIKVCVDWDPNPCGSHKWDIGCCLAYDTQCDPECDTGGGGTNQPPTISHVLNCTQPGSNGWCMGNLSLDLSASDPQGSQVIISGDVNGIVFVCPVGATTCSIPLSEGAGNANYRVDAASTGLFAIGTTTYLLDSSTPQLNGSVSGVVGTNGWYKSNVTLTVAASDAVSGIASTSATIDDESQTVYSAPIVLTDGIHTVVLTTTDNAGHVTQTTQTFNIDTVTPVLNVSLSGSMGTNNWYISDVTVTPSASDSGSGLASLEATIDGGPWTVVNNPLPFTDGIHSFQFRATDNAGNITESGGTLNIDTTTPALNLTTTGTTGLNGWYRSSAQITALGTDATSGVAKIEVSTNGGAFLLYTLPVIVNDGQHSYQFKVTDNAGNVTQTAKAVKVDTVTPSLSVNLSGTRGQNDWYVSSTSVTPTAADATSGIATLEVSQDGSAYTAYQSTTFSDGMHTYRFKATDNSGNVTETPVQNLKVDTIAPVIEMMDELKLGEYLYYYLEDPTVAGQENSGLAIYRAVIEDDDEKYQKIVWADGLTGDKARDSILWDGKFSDGAQVGWGSYFITLKISDAAGNERMRTAIVKVGLFSFLEEIPAFTPPQTTTLPAQITETDSAAVTEFGGTNSAATGEATSESTLEGGTNSGAIGAASASISAGGIAPIRHETEYVKSGFTQESQSTNAPISNTNILWGAAATAMLGATLADWQRKREEEEARKRAEAAAQAEKGGSGKKTPGQRVYEKIMQQKRIIGVSQALLNEKARKRAEQAEAARQNLIAKNEDRAPIDIAKVNQLVEADSAREKLIAKNEDKAPIDMVKVNALVETQTKQEVENISWWQKGAEFAEKILPQPIKQVLNLKAIAGTVLTLALGGASFLGINNIINDPHAFDDAQRNAQTEFTLLDQEHPEFREEKRSLLYLITNPYEVFSSGYDVTKAVANSLAGYVDAAWQHNPFNQVISDGLKQIGDSCPESLGEAWIRRCSAVPHFLAGVTDHPADTTIGVLTSLVADPVAGYIKLSTYHYKNNNPYQLIADMYQSAQKDGLIEGIVNIITDRIDGAWNLVTTDPQVQSFGVITLFTLATLVGLGIPALLAGSAMVLSQTANLLTQVDAALQSAPTREEAMQAVINPQTRRQLATTIVLLGLLIYGGAKELDTYSKVTTFRESLPPSAQTSLLEMSYAEQVKLFNAVETLKISPKALEFYLTESTRPNSVLAELPLADALRISNLAEQTGKGAFLIDYIGRYGYNDALKLASPEVIKGMTNDKFLVQAQDILSKDAGYNLTPEEVFMRYPGSTIGLKSTFITNEAAISGIIGDFHGTKIIYITFDQAVALEDALGLPPKTLVDGFRISKISNLDNMNLSYPADGTNEFFLGSGKGLPGGGAEITINPPVSMNSPNVVDQVIIKVYP